MKIDAGESSERSEQDEIAAFPAARSCAPTPSRPAGSLAALRLAGLALALLPLVALAAPVRWHRTTDQVRKALSVSPHAGDCEQCHTQHGAGQIPTYENALLGPDDNTLCDRCHTEPWAGGSYAGTWLYVGSAHGSSSTMVWPGPEPPARTDAGASGKCLNCHDPHGYEDATGPIPHLGLQREEKLCLTCHDGSPAAADIRSDLLKPFRHPVTDFSGRHTGPGESQPTDFGVTPLSQRHSECPDCHNPHVARGDSPGPPTAAEASKKLLGASRVLVLNGAAGSEPSYTFVAASDTLTGSPTEYQLCFKCHSSWTTQPAGQTDLAVAFNPNNASYHPVEAVGRDGGIAFAAFAPGWSPGSMTACGDCHASDFGPRGPHGSAYRYILKRPSTASPAPRLMTSDELCFSCHAYDVYANPASTPEVRAASRFNAPGAAQGHAEHVGTEQVPCYACHVTHGSPTLPHLLVTGRSPGIVSFTETPTGGTCAPTCHGSQTYSTNYAR